MSDLPIVKRKSGGRRTQPMTGPLTYDEGFGADGTIPYGFNGRGVSEEYYKLGEVGRTGVALGMPAVITGHPLGCGCAEAYLHAVGQIIDGQIEADYMCDAGWHNFVVFEMEQMGKQQGLVVNANGELVETQDVGHGDTELGEY